MRITVERLRVGLVAGALLLVVVLAGFFGYARYRLRRALVDLPERMGATITKEFNGYTYSQSDHGKTVFTIHASKAVQHTDGTLTLHEVSMVIYGKKGDRADRISGDEFEYNTKEDVIRAAGIVHLDLAAPVTEGTQTSEAAKHLDPASAGVAGAQGNAGRVVHVTTSGLVYLKKLGIAATKDGIDFAFGGFTGHAVGAEYNSDSGNLVLQSALTMSGLDRGKPLALTASHGELNHAQNVAEFNDARYSSAGEIARADVARLHMRADGSVERVEGERHVSLEEPAGGSVTAYRGDAALDAKSKPQTAVFTGSVHFAADEAPRQAHGDAERASVKFNGQGHIDHALLEGKVRTSEVVRRIGGASGAASQRDLSADSIELWLGAEGVGGKPMLRDVKASGSARMSSVAPDAKGGGTTTSKLAGDLLLGHMVARSGVTELSTVHGVGHTLVQQVNAKNGEQRSAGETLDAVFRPSGRGKGDVELSSAVQEGGVVIDRSIPAKPSAAGAARIGPQVQHATAAKAVFDADTSKLTLTADTRSRDGGEVRMRDAESDISAMRVVMDQDTGDATAEGGVKVSYLQRGPGARAGSGSGSGVAEPVHVLAARAELNHDAGRATFYGRAISDAGAGSSGRSRLARMWRAGMNGQGGSEIEAPVLVFEQEEKRLTARAESAGVVGTVHAVLVSAASANGATEPGKPVESHNAGGEPVKGASGPVSGPGDAVGKAKAATKTTQPGVARITSSLLVYSDLKRQAEFSGGVRVLDQGGEMAAQEATVFLSPATTGKAVKPDGAGVSGGNAAAGLGANGGPGSSLTGLFGGNVERIVATQHVEITQPGRKATGERLIYTASDQMFVLTGTSTAPPKVVDAMQGMTTGAMLRFHAGDESVVVSGIDGTGSARRVRTETTVKPEAGGQTDKDRKTGAKVHSGTKVKEK